MSFTEKIDSGKKRKNAQLFFNPVFKPVHETKCRYVLMKGSAGSGKSVDAAQYYILKLLREPRCNLLAVRKIYDSNRYSTFAELNQAIVRMGVQDMFEIINTPFEIRCKTGNRIVFCGCNDAGQRAKLKSINVPEGKITDIWIEEATDLTPEDFWILDDRLRGELPDGMFYQIRMTFNPVSGSHWIKKQFFDRIDSEVFCHHSTYLDNLFCDAAYHNRMECRKKLDPEGYRIYGLGEWGETGGLILPNIEVREFDREERCFDSVSIGQDFGSNNPNAILELGIRDGDVYVRGELYLQGMDTKEIIEAAGREGFDKRQVMFCDSAEPDRIHSWCKAGWRAVGAYKCSGSVKAEIDWLKQRKIILRPECKNTISEIQKWRWQQDSDGNYTDSPVPVDDHAIAALRYGTEPWRKGKSQFKPKGERRRKKSAFYLDLVSPEKKEII